MSGKCQYGTLVDAYGGEGGLLSQMNCASGGGLPFTGLDVVLIVLGGLILLGVGLALRWANRPAG